MRVIFAAVMGVMVMSGCQATEPTRTGVIRDEPRETCNLNEFEGLRWQDASVLNGLDLSPKTRIIRPGTAVTQDFRPDRLNFFVGETNRIERIACG